MKLFRLMTDNATYGTVDIVFGQYANGDYAIQIYEERTGDLLLTPTVNLAQYGLRPDENHVFIKDYAENKGVYKELVDNGIVEMFDPEERRVTFGPYDASALMAKLSEDSLAVIEEEKREAAL